MVNEILLALFGQENGQLAIKVWPYVLSGLGFVFTTIVAIFALIVKVWIVPMIFTWWDNKKNNQNVLLEMCAKTLKELTTMNERIEAILKSKNDLDSATAQSVFGVIFGKYVAEMNHFMRTTIQENHFIDSDGLPSVVVVDRYNQFFDRTCKRWLYMCRQLTVEGKPLSVWAEYSHDLFSYLKNRAYNHHYAIAYKQQTEDKDFEVFLDHLQSEVMSSVVLYAKNDVTLKDMFSDRVDPTNEKTMRSIR